MYFISQIIPNKKIRHAKGKSNVVIKLRDLEGCVGMIDEDVGTPVAELENFLTINHEQDTQFLYHNSDNTKRLVILEPRLEDWLYKRAKVNKIKPIDFQLPPQPKELKRIAHYEQGLKFRSFLSKLIANDQLISKIVDWLS